ncbi:MAG TPA: hypothetical protein DIC52_23810 [Candidatus Latescibacteria bacterium]|nr:hypothetical protein [Candidatus Latescibacterota bacterium]
MGSLTGKSRTLALVAQDLGSQYLLVRITEFELDYVVDRRRQTHRVIVGERFRQTPQFASEVTHVVVHPSWHVPARIADEELAPTLGRLSQQGFEAWTHAGDRVDMDSLAWEDESGFSSKYRLVQRAGPSNPLGRVKLELVNPFAVASPTLREALTSGQSGRVDLPEPLPVYLLYWPASVAPDGEIRSSDDFYDVDPSLLQALRRSTGARHWIDASLRGS